MKRKMGYRNPIFILEVKKRLADKKYNEIRKRLISIDKFPKQEIESQKSSFSRSKSHSQSNFNYFMNFIKEKGYKSAFTKIGNTFNIRNLKIQNNKNTNSIKGTPNIIKLYHQLKQNFSNISNINIKKYKNNNQKQTPFQINHTKNNFLKNYIRYIRKKNSQDYIENEKCILSFSINSSGQKKKIFGKKHIEFKKAHEINNYFTPNLTTNKITLNKVNSCTDFRNKYFCKDFDLTRKSNIMKPNCYYNRLNLSKYSIKSERK